MNNMKDFLRDFGYFGVGAAALVVETGVKAVNTLVKKGKKTLRDNQDTVDEIKRKAKEAGQRFKDVVEKATSAPAEEKPSAEEPSVVKPVTPDAIYHTDEPVPPEVPVPEEPTVEPIECPDVPTPEEPIMTDVPEDPEETING